MKIFTIIAFVLIASSSYSQSIPNSGFENWENIESYQEPVDWNTLNPDLAALGASVGTVQTNDAHEGVGAVKLTTQQVLTVVSPAALTLGNVVKTSMLDRDIRGGIASTAKPQRFEGYYKFSPQGTDAGFIACIMFKHNYVTGLQDTVGAAIFKPRDPVSEYTKFSVDFDYDNPNYIDDTPDSMNVIITSSFKFTVTSANVGTELYVDDLEVIHDTSNAVESIKYEPILNAFYNASNNCLVVDNEENVNYTLTLYDVCGRIVYKPKSEVIKGVNRYELTKVIPGIYFVHCYDAANRKKFVKRVYVQ